MRLDVYVPVLAALLFGGAIRPLSRLWTPRAGARLLVCAGLVSAGCWVWALGLLGWTLLGQVPTVARYGQWSVSVLHRVDPVSPAVAYTAIAILLALTVLVAVTTVRRTRALLRSCSLARSLAPAAHGDLIVVPDDAVDAFALPAFAVPAFVRRVLVSSGRPRLAGPRVPDLDVRRPGRGRAGGAWAGAGLAVRRQPPPGTTAGGRGLALGYGTTAVRARVAALLDPPPRFRRSAVFFLVVAAAVVLGCAVDAGHDVERLFEIAMLGPR